MPERRQIQHFVLFLFQMKDEYPRTVFAFFCRGVFVRCPAIPFHETETFNPVQLNPLALQQVFCSLSFFGAYFHRFIF
jgi:hypothetical protein